MTWDLGVESLVIWLRALQSLTLSGGGHLPFAPRSLFPNVLELSIPSEGYRHILVCVDELTGFMILVPVVTQ
jgi:hypothetical protein